jgi:hypothetical protein
MTTKIPTQILKDDEESIVDLLHEYSTDAKDFDDPENGDFLDRMETLFLNAGELDATIVKLALDRAHYFLDELPAYRLSSADRERALSTSPAKDRLLKALESTVIVESEGLRKEVLEITDRLQVHHFWGDTQTPDSNILRGLIGLITTHNIKDDALAEFILWGILSPWNELITTDWFDDGVSLKDHSEWLYFCDLLSATQWGRV